MAANPDDPHFSVGMEDALAERPPYQFQDAVNQARYDRGYMAGELTLLEREYGKRRQNLTGWSESFDAFESRMRAKGLVRG